MKIVVLDGYTLNPGDLSWESLRELGELTVYDRTNEEDVLERIGDAEAVFTNKTRLTRSIFDSAPKIKWVGVLATGYDVVDIAAAREKGIPVCNVPGYSTASVAEMTFSLILELYRHAGSHSDAVMKGEWTLNPDFCFWKHPMSELNGRTIGIIGFGKIGQRVAVIAQAFGLSVLACDQCRSLPETDTLKYASLNELLMKSDIVTLHCPLTEETRNIINKDTISNMKDGAILINTARGPLVDECALRDALDSGKLAGAGCDVVSAEPIKQDNPLLKAKNIIITPHISWASKQARQRLMDITAENLRSYLGGQIINRVN
jgi:glycerate dehydrogenase